MKAPQEFPKQEVCSVLSEITGLTPGDVMVHLGQGFGLSVWFASPRTREVLKAQLQHVRLAKKRAEVLSGQLNDFVTDFPFYQDHFAEHARLMEKLLLHEKNLVFALRLGEANAAKRRLHLVADAVLRVFHSAGLNPSAATGSIFVRAIDDVYGRIFSESIDARRAAKLALARCEKMNRIS